MTGARRRLIGALGFDLDEAKLRCAELDDDDLAAVEVHPSFDAALDALPQQAPVVAFVTRATKEYTEVVYRPADVCHQDGRVCEGELAGVPAQPQHEQVEPAGSVTGGQCDAVRYREQIGGSCSTRTWSTGWSGSHQRPVDQGRPNRTLDPGW